MLYKDITDWDTYLSICTKRLKKAGMYNSEYESVIKECYDLNIGHMDAITMCALKEEKRLIKILEELKKDQCGN